MNWLHILITMINKDLMIEYRTKTLYISVLSFASLMVVLLGFSLNGTSAMPVSWESGTLWLIVFISCVISFSRQDDKERWSDAHAGNLIAPVDRSLVFYSRVATSLVFVAAVEIIIIPLFFLMLHAFVPSHLFPFIGVMLLGTMGYVALGTFLASVVFASNLREILLPVMLFPLSIPLFLAVILLTSGTIVGDMQGDLLWWGVLGAYVVIFLVLPGLLFDLLVEV